MAKISSIAKNNRRRKMAEKGEPKRAELRNMHCQILTLSMKIEIML